MDSTPLISTKKCPHCQQWSKWQLKPDDRCEHCGNILDPRAQQNAEDRTQLENQKMPALFMVEIKPEDGWMVRILKKAALGGQLLFASIIAFIVWLVTLAAG